MSYAVKKNIHNYFDAPQQKFLMGIAFYFSIFVFAYLFFYFFDVYTVLPSNTNLTKWDAHWYNIIKTRGYEYYWYLPSDSAFFPLFPFLWKLFHLNPLGISILNMLFFVTSVSLLIKTFQFETSKVLMYLSIPSCVFFFLPYSESLFFFFCTLFLIGLKTDNTRLIIFGLFFCSLTRATAMFFVPSIILMEFFYCDKFIDRRVVRNTFLYSFVSILGLGCVVLFQYIETNTWFAFAKQQVNFWGHYFRWPGFPLVSHGGEKTLWIDSLAFLSGVIALTLIILFFIRKCLHKESLIYKNKPFWFSACYLLMVTIYSLFFNFKCLDAQTSIDSINRYIFSTAFSMFFLLTILNYFALKLKYFLFFMFVFILTYLLFGLGGPPISIITKDKHGTNGSFIFFLIIFFYAVFFYLSSHKAYGKYFAFSFMTLNIVLSTFALHTFLKGDWIG